MKYPRQASNLQPSAPWAGRETSQSTGGDVVYDVKSSVASGGEPADRVALGYSGTVATANADFLVRAVFKGNLKASIIACLIDDPDAGESEAELARRCDVTRKAISDALDDLQLCGLIERSTKGRRTAVELIGSFEMQPI